MKANIKLFAAVPCIMVWLIACGSYSWKTAENTREEPKPIGRLTAEFTNTLGMKFVLIPAGTFILGSPLNEPGRNSDERQHSVSLTRPFYMQTTEVIQGQWQAVIGDNPSHFCDCGNWWWFARFCRSANRIPYMPFDHTEDIGFRLVMTP